MPAPTAVPMLDAEDEVGVAVTVTVDVVVVLSFVHVGFPSSSRIAVLGSVVDPDVLFMIT